jgi:hypothetical protein
MKRFALLVVLQFPFLFLTSSALADSIAINSSASETTNNSGSPTQDISPVPAWAPALGGSSWISFANAGEVPNGTGVTFTDTFNLSGPVAGATLRVLADDTASVIVNGTTIFAANLNGSYPTCSSVPIGCLTSTEGVFTLAQLQPYLNVGSNTISFTVYQEAGDGYGLDYSGSFTTGTATVPESGTFVLVGCGFIGLACGNVVHSLRGFRKLRLG